MDTWFTSVFLTLTRIWKTGINSEMGRTKKPYQMRADQRTLHSKLCSIQMRQNTEDTRDWTTVQISFLRLSNIMGFPILSWCTFQAEWPSSFRMWICPNEEPGFQLRQGKMCVLFSCSCCHIVYNVEALQNVVPSQNVRYQKLKIGLCK
uniref:Uncharacterized protein n=1 Tax=Myotis myotis TaxID=51298 RepID=A0A7J7ZXS4_MYOMY|nr:hypothetical protein mMyoMyo1_009844 [Myotis myotis]